MKRMLQTFSLTLGWIVGAVTLPLQNASPAFAQAPASGQVRQIGTVRSMDGSVLVLATDKGEQLSVALSPETKVVQLPVGSTDMKTAQPAVLGDVAVGDRVLAIGSAAEAPVALTARRLVLMKSTDIAERRSKEQAGWQRGSGGIVQAVDPASGMVTVISGSRTASVATSNATIFRRYAPTSARFEDATRSSLADLHPGDQMRVRGERASDGSIKADEIVSGSFRHLSGTIQAIDLAANQLTVKDSKTGSPVTLSITPGTAMHRLPPEVASRFAGHARAPGAASGRPAAGSTAPGTAAVAPAPVATSEPGGARSAGGDLSLVVSRLPETPLSDFKAGQAVMVVGTDGTSGSIAALTVLGGVESILAASPGGGAEVALSPWSMGGGGEGGGGAAQ